MYTKSQYKINDIDLKAKLKELQVEKFSKQIGFSQRKSGKIRVTHLLLGFFYCLSNPQLSLHNWSLEIGLLLKKTIVNRPYSIE
jgi:hypothetical protein